MASSWLFRPLPLRERVGRGVARVSSTLPTRRLVVPSPPHPNPLPQGEREPEVAPAKRIIANSTVSGQNLVGSHGDRRHAGVGGSLKSGFLYFSLPTTRPVPVKSWSCTGWFGQWSPDPPGLCDRRRRGEKRAQSLLERNRFAVGQKRNTGVSHGFIFRPWPFL